MKAKFICNYLHNSGEICSKFSIRPEGCRSHYKSKKCRCSQCNKSYYMIQYVNRLWDKTQMYDQLSKEGFL